MNNLAQKKIERITALLFSVLLLLSMSATMFAAGAGDSVVIEKKKVVLVRTGKLIRDFPEKKRAIVSYPILKSGISSPAVLRKVRSMLQVKNIFDTSIEEYRADTWLEEFDYEVNYNKNFILDLTFMQTGTAAYPDSQRKHLAINLKTGNLIKAREVFKPASLKTLADLLDQKLQDEIRQTQAETANDMNQEERDGMKEMYANLKFKVENLDDFIVSDKGVTFLYEADFPHVVQALEPVGEYFFSYAELRPHIQQEGLLGVFIK